MKMLDTCPVCHSEEIVLNYRHRDGNEAGRCWSVFVCRMCTHGFVNPQPSWDELTPYYPPEYAPYDERHGADGEVEDVVRNAVARGEFRHVPIRAGMRLLDVGCGGGYFLQIASRMGAQVQGVELSGSGVMQARAAGVPVFHGTVQQYAALHESTCFDAITAIHVIEHMHDPVDALCVLRQLLARDGVATIIVPNAGCWPSLSLRGYWHSTDLPRHLMHFTVDSLRRCGTQAGLHAHDCFTYSLARAVASSVRLWLRRKSLLSSRLTRHLSPIDKWLAPWLRQRMDRRASGEAIIMRFKRAAI